MSIGAVRWLIPQIISAMSTPKTREGKLSEYGPHLTSNIPVRMNNWQSLLS